MKFTCSNLRKTDQLKTTEKGYSFLKEEFNAKNAYFIPATLKNEYAQLFMVVDGTFKKKSYLHFKSQSWLTGITDDDCDDEDAVKALNKEVADTFEGVTEVGGTLPIDLEMSARVHKTTTMSPMLFCKGIILSADAVYYRKVDDIDVIFCERVTSYTRTFDMSVVLKDKTVETHSCMDRKRLSQIMSWSAENKIEIYQTGPDPLNWRDMHKCRETSTWGEINRMLNVETEDIDDEESEWDEGMTESESETESEEDYPSEESESDYSETDEDEDEDYAFGIGKHARSDSDSDEEYNHKKTKY